MSTYRPWPVPESLSNGEGWKVYERTPEEMNRGLHPCTDLVNREMWVPMGSDYQSENIRRHELAHAAWSKGSAADTCARLQVSNSSWQHAEDMRVNTNLLKAGVDIRKGMQAEEGLRALGTRCSKWNKEGRSTDAFNTASAFAISAYGTKDYRKILLGLPKDLRAKVEATVLAGYTILHEGIGHADMIPETNSEKLAVYLNDIWNGFEHHEPPPPPPGIPNMGSPGGQGEESDEGYPSDSEDDSDDDDDPSDEGELVEAAGGPQGKQETQGTPTPAQAQAEGSPAKDGPSKPSKKESKHVGWGGGKPGDGTFIPPTHADKTYVPAPPRTAKGIEVPRTPAPEITWTPPPLTTAQIKARKAKIEKAAPARKVVVNDGSEQVVKPVGPADATLTDVGLMEKWTRNAAPVPSRNAASKQRFPIDQVLNGDWAEPTGKPKPLSALQQANGMGLGDTVWGPLWIEEPPRADDILGKIKLRKAPKSSDCGDNIRAVHRIITDGMIFKRKLRSKGGSVLIDGSGSMSMTNDMIRSIIYAAPLATIAVYGANTNNGTLRILAKGGKMVDEEMVTSPGGENVVDGPALLWLSKQQQPRFWVSDGMVTGLAMDRFHETRVSSGPEAARLVGQSMTICRVGKISRIPTVNAAVRVFTAGKRGKVQK